MASIDLERARATIDGLMDAYRAIDDAQMSILPSTLTSGKVYEAWVLCELLKRLHDDEGYTAIRRRSNKVTFKSAPGPINRRYPYFELNKTGRPTLELWTDIEFIAMSYEMRGGTTPLRAERHELDLVVVPSGIGSYPSHRQIRIGVECKNTGYTKDLLRSVLGVRRELSLRHDVDTRFALWPRATVPAEPPSCLLVYSSDPDEKVYETPGLTYGVDFFHLSLP